VLEGSVRWERDSVRLNFTLIHGPSERRLWSGDFSGGMGELLALQRRVVRQVVDGIDLAVSPEARDRLDRPPYDPDPEAYEAYVKGRYHAGLYNAADAERATDHFRQAVELDPGFVLARAALAENRCVLYWALPIEPTPTAEECEEVSRNVIASDPTLAEAHSVLAMAKIRKWEWNEAEAAFRRALDLNPNAVLPRTWYGWFLTEVGRPNEGLVEARRAEALAPVELFTKTLVAQPLMNLHRYEEALAQMDSVLRLDPDYGAAWIYRAHIYALMGEPELSREATDRVVQELGEDFAQAIGLYAWSYALEGDESRALELLAELEALHPAAFVQLPAVVYLQLGREDEALDVLERSYEFREEFLPNATSSPHLDSIRDHPRFRALREKMGLAGV
jgi:Tfp pilus assembly protein PilF